MHGSPYGAFIRVALPSSRRIGGSHKLHAEVQDFLESSRWVHAVVPYGNGTQGLHVIRFHGFPGASIDPVKRVQNVRYLKSMFSHACSLGTVPILICMDANIQRQASEVLTGIVASQVFIDFGEEFARPMGPPPHVL